MERGPMALFGAIVAIGIGPALWLGAQFGNLDVTPNNPPTVVSEQKVDKGGAGAAAEEPTVEPTKHTRYVPLSGTPSARPSSSATADAPAEQETTEPPVAAEPTETDDPVIPPVDDTPGTGDPTNPSNGDEEPVDPAPPVPNDPADGQAAGETGG
jgi:hypothetical protein